VKVYRDVAQGSADWFRLRMGIPTASCFGRIITAKREEYSTQSKGYQFQLLAERLLQTPTESVQGQEWMERGKELEPDAAKEYEMVFEVETEPVGFVTTDDGMVGASPDRFIKGLPAGLEIKCPKPATHLEYLLDGPGADYRAQVQGQIWVCEFERSDFYSYHPRCPAARIVTQRDDPFIEKIKRYLQRFNEELFDLYERAKQLGIFQAYENAATPIEREQAEQLAGQLEREHVPPEDRRGAPPIDGEKPIDGLMKELSSAIVIVRGKDRADPCQSIDEWRTRMLKGIDKLPEDSCELLLNLNAANMAEMERAHPEDVTIVRQAFEAKIGRDR
jgi:hypothetical protein